MKNRYEKVVLEAEEGINFEVSEGTNGELIVKIKASNKKDVCIKNYEKIPIPDGFFHVFGEWNEGFIIERLEDRSQFIWIPVWNLECNGTLDGIHFYEKFGRRDFRREKFSEKEFNENLSNELIEQLESVKKYGGFYISRYAISKSPEGKPQSVKGVLPWVNISFDEAVKVAGSFANTEEVQSHLPYGAEYDSVLEWFIKSKARTLMEVAKDSTSWGNYWRTKKSPKKITNTGSNERWCTNNIYDLAGNVDEWTQEQRGNLYRVLRGGNYINIMQYYPVAYRCCSYPNIGYNYVGFRIALCIK